MPRITLCFARQDECPITAVLQPLTWQFWRPCKQLRRYQSTRPHHPKRPYVQYATASHCRLQHWAQLISDAEAPIALSARDGKLLKRVSPEHRFDADDLRQCIGAMLLEQPWQARAFRELLLAAWAAGRAPGRAACGLIRGAVYLQRGALDVAMRARLHSP